MRATPIVVAVLALGALVGGYTSSSETATPAAVQSAVALTTPADGTVGLEDNHGNG
ncbi:hypothetical protein [Streptomyces badius]|uniref:Uncharacterized protein n=1 Tax=Streptomyces badius TaxID=1941 RepID=A0ABQ2TP11_STRBA|nr:hypothetical protein [Streptomyces badius]GGS81725.1 hypothetical protein GCM10010253_65500 [Streptomyces badius]